MYFEITKIIFKKVLRDTWATWRSHKRILRRFKEPIETYGLSWTLYILPLNFMSKPIPPPSSLINYSTKISTYNFPKTNFPSSQFPLEIPRKENKNFKLLPSNIPKCFKTSTFTLSALERKQQNKKRLQIYYHHQYSTNSTSSSKVNNLPSSSFPVYFVMSIYI